jgi:hypothetical protein
LLIADFYRMTTRGRRGPAHRASPKGGGRRVWPQLGANVQTAIDVAGAMVARSHEHE